jgi:hypothetical protein
VRRGAAILAAGAMILAACSGDDDTVATPASTAAASPATTTSSSTSTSTTSTTTTTTAATTTTIPIEVEIQAALDFFVDSYVTCLEQPAECDRSFVVSGAPMADTILELSQQYINDDRYLATDRRGTYIRLQSFERVGSETIIATTCLYDATIQLGPDGPDGQPTTVNDRITSRIFDFTLVDSDGRWLTSELREIELLAEGSDACGG